MVCGQINLLLDIEPHLALARLQTRKRMLGRSGVRILTKGAGGIRRNRTHKRIHYMDATLPQRLL